MIIRSFYDIGNRLELTRDLRVSGRPTDPHEPVSPGFFAGTPDHHVFVVPSPRGPCLGFDDHLVVLDDHTHVGLHAAFDGRVLVVSRGGEPIARIAAPEADDYIDGDDEMNDFFLWLCGRFDRPEARAAYTIGG
jgi:hypothetical protein